MKSVIALLLALAAALAPCGASAWEITSESRLRYHFSKDEIKPLYETALSELGAYASQEEVLDWFVREAEAGNLDAQYTLGVLLYKGEGVAQDREAGFAWLIPIAETGHAQAQQFLGWAYYYDDGYEDYEKSAYWYEKAARQGRVFPQQMMGSMYRRGKGVAQDGEMAVYWYELAARQGDEQSQYALGQMYVNGEGIGQDLKKGAYWMEKSAEQDNSWAQYYTALMYASGKGVAQSDDTAIEWLNRSAGEGHYEAKRYVMALRGMSRPINWQQVKLQAAQIQQREVQEFMRDYNKKKESGFEWWTALQRVMPVLCGCAFARAVMGRKKKDQE